MIWYNLIQMFMSLLNTDMQFIISKLMLIPLIKEELILDFRLPGSSWNMGSPYSSRN